MSNINGDWFHSRSSSNLSELIAVRKIIKESEKSTYHSLKWSGGREAHSELFDLAQVAAVKPSTMQTKVRAMVRFGFVQDRSTCPIQWTQMGRLWDNLYTLGNTDAAKEIYQLTLTTSLAMASFNSTDFSLNPSKGDLPLKYLLNKLDKNNSILLDEFENLVDGNSSRKVSRNTPYWIKDLENSGLFMKTDKELIYTGKFRDLIKDIKGFNPDPSLSDEDWASIRQNPLIEKSPFKTSVQQIFEKIIMAKNLEENELVEPLVEVISEEQEKDLPQVDILNSDTKYANSSRKVRNTTWSKRVKKRFNYKCALPDCDVEGEMFVNACHIKPDSIENDVVPHRAHILNGICFCKLCHTLFDEGYFTLSDNGEIIVSEHITELQNQNIIKILLSSNGKVIKNSNDGRLPLKEFIEYHRNNIFKK